MKITTGLIALGAAIQQVSALGYTTYTEIDEGVDNSAKLVYSEPERSTTLFLYIQILPYGGDHADIISDFYTLAENYGSHGISVIPRVRYGFANFTVTTEPNEDILLPDVELFAEVFSNATNYIDIPVLQAGFLGEWGEWHSGQYCQAQGTADTAEDLAIKAQVVSTLQTTGLKVALRYPQDHSALVNGTRDVTIHDDCIFDGGFGGYDGGTFPSDDYDYWVSYTMEVASNNTFGGEGCNNAGDSTYNWNDTSALCGSDGLAAYINYFGMTYFNDETPDPFETMFFDADDDSTYLECIEAIETALNQWS